MDQGFQRRSDAFIPSQLMTQFATEASEVIADNCCVSCINRDEVSNMTVVV